MKRKNSDSQARRWLPRAGITVVLLLLLIPAMIFSLIQGTIYYDTISPSPVDALVGRFTAFVHTPSYAILQEVLRTEPVGTLYLTGWIEPPGIRCLGMIWIEQSRSPQSGYDFHGSMAECDLDRYSIDQFWTGYGWDHDPFSVAYGYSGRAASIVVTWQDGTVTRHAPVNGTYLSIHQERLQVIESVDFRDLSGALIYRFPDSKRSETVARRNES